MTRREAQSPELWVVIQGLRRRRMQLGLSQFQVAEKMGYAQTQISQWENGKRGITFPALADWAEALGGEVELYLTFPPIERTTVTTTLKPQ